MDPAATRALDSDQTKRRLKILHRASADIFRTPRSQTPIQWWSAAFCPPHFVHTKHGSSSASTIIAAFQKRWAMTSSFKTEITLKIPMPNLFDLCHKLEHDCHTPHDATALVSEMMNNLLHFGAVHLHPRPFPNERSPFLCKITLAVRHFRSIEPLLYNLLFMSKMSSLN